MAAVGAARFELAAFPILSGRDDIKKAIQINEWLLSGRQDSNLRPPHPKCGAMTGLRYAPKKILSGLTKNCGEGGIRTHGTVLPVRRFSKPFLSATQAPLRQYYYFKILPLIL